MTIEAQVRSAANPQEALLAIAKGLDQLLAQQAPPTDAWSGSWVQMPEAVQQRARTEITGDEAAVEVVIPPPSEEKMERRRQFERQYLKLSEYLGSEENWTEAYAKGGPTWLYYGNRELVTTFPGPVKAAMIEDVQETSPDEAHEIARDLLKFRGETGPGHPAMMVGEGDIG